MFVPLSGFGARPRPRYAPPAATGVAGGRPSNLGATVKRNYGRMKYCYEKAARQGRLGNPRLKISLSLWPSGKVRAIQIYPRKHHVDSLGQCLRRSIGRWRFPTHSGIYTYDFSARFSGS